MMLVLIRDNNPKSHHNYGEIAALLEGRTHRVPFYTCHIFSDTNSDGYGQFSFSGKHYRAHRVAYEVAKGKIPAGMFVCHTCDNPSCVNPDHLFLGTHSDNMLDMHKKRRGPRICGENNGRAKLSIANIERIKALHQSGRSQASLARELGVAQATISRVINGKRWTSHDLVR